MTDILQILLISNNQDVCNVVHTALACHDYRVMCVSSSRDAIQVLNRGVRAEYVLIDATSQQNEQMVEPRLLQMVKRERFCILSDEDNDMGQSFASEWSITTVLTRSRIQQDLVNLLRRQLPTEMSDHCKHSAASQDYHLEELSNGRFFLAGTPVMMQLYREIRVLAPIDIPVLILGESGVGKEIVAMLLHKYHTRSENPFLNINCAALPTELLESELFGYEAGAFTGAMKAKPGKFELANNGTLLLDEIGEMSPQMQAKLLHVMQDGSFCRLGGRSSTQVNVRVLAATNIDMQTAIAEKRFREDLYYRLNTLTLTIPPLRERKEEIPLLIEELNCRGVSGVDQPVVLSDRLIMAAMEYHWPGNLRELRNFVIRTLILRDQESAYAYLRAKTQGQSASPTASSTAELVESKSTYPPGMKSAISEVKNQTEIRMLQDALSASGWNRRKAAMNLNISYRSLLYKIQQHGLSA